MQFILNTLKKGFFWSYARTSWQWDVLCVVILAFIFLTPKSWFENTGFQKSRTGMNPTRQVLVLGPDVVGAQPDTREIERRVRALSGRADAQVTEVRPKHDAQGNVIGYEVDFR